MTKEEQRKMLEAMLAASSAKITKLAPQVEQPAALSASFKQVGIDKKRQDVKTKTKTKTKAKAKRVKRNWEAQRRYDEIHGTSNGYDERIEQAILDRRYESGDY